MCLKVEIQVRKIFCVDKAMPTLPINVEDAARSDVEIEKALQVRSLIKTSLSISLVIPTYLSISIRRCYQLMAYLQSAWTLLKFITEKLAISTYIYHWIIWWVQNGEQLVRVNQDTRLNYRVLDFRTPANQAIFRIQGQVGNVSYCPFWILDKLLVIIIIIIVHLVSILVICRCRISSWPL